MEVRNEISHARHDLNALDLFNEATSVVQLIFKMKGLALKNGNSSVNLRI